MKRNLILIVTATAMFIGACVPAKQFQALQDENNKCNEERNLLNSKNEVLGVENTEMKNRIANLEKQHELLVSDTAAKSEEIKLLRESKDQLSKRYEDIQAAQNALIQGNANETRRLLQELQKTQDDLQKREDRLRELELLLNQKKNNLDVVKQNLDDLKGELDKKDKEIAARNARLIELERNLQRKDSIMSALKTRIQKALLGFENMGLTVTNRNGKVYVSMAEKLLFKSGSITVDPKGVQALKELSKVLAQNQDITVVVEGHTDDVPMTANASMQDNWDLSVKRATSIARIILENKSIDPKRIVASGRGEHLPVENAKTPEARQKNRRTEIILSPNLDEIINMVNKE